LEGFQVVDQKVAEISVKITGSPYTPFENKTFLFIVTIPSDFPFSQPQIFFKTPIFHPNINFKFTDEEYTGSGEISLPLEMEGIKVWSPKASVEICKKKLKINIFFY
jgi:ubiquitin-protein ligase